MPKDKKGGRNLKKGKYTGGNQIKPEIGNIRGYDSKP